MSRLGLGAGALVLAPGLMMLIAGCGDALSSLDSVQESQLEQYTMQLIPDYGRRGQTVEVQVQLDESLTERLAGQLAYPTEIQFGPGTALRSFGTEGDGQMFAEILISPLAQEGERQPVLLIPVGEVFCEAQGRFWILPSLVDSPE